MSEDVGNVVPLHPAMHAPQTAAQLDDPIATLMQFCERLSEGMSHITAVLVQLDVRTRRVELLINKIEREKITKSAIYNGQGERVR